MLDYLARKSKIFLRESVSEGIRATRKPKSVLKYLGEIESESAARDIANRLTRDSLVFSSTVALRHFAMQKKFLGFDSPGAIVLDLGVAEGQSSLIMANQMIDSPACVFSFDAFEGIRDPWSKPDRPPGSMDMGGHIPDALLNHPNIQVVKGWVEDTLEDFLAKKDGSFVSFVHFDLDVYPPTKFALEKLLPWFRKGSHILFDDMYGFAGWRNHSHLALNEVLGKHQLTPLAFSRKQAFFRVDG